ncbi:MAG: hypothetical protein JXA37_12515 [Chloroflexia bacterium]|nr:hypothetical protein [Chloroflexia bacterium]
MKSHWTTYKGQRILYCDYRDFSLDALQGLRAELEAVQELLSPEAPASVLALSDVRGSVASPEAVNLFKQASVQTAGYVQKQAVVGVTGLKKVFFDVIVRLSGQDARAFAELEPAQDWLVEESGV